jgi:hypothetical protein
MEPSVWGYNWATLFLGDINTRSGPPSWESLESETVKYGHKSRGYSDSRMTARARTRSNCK